MNKAWNITYYVSTVLFSLFILLGSYFDVILAPEAIAVMTKLGYPQYMLLIVGWAKILGIIGIWQNAVKFLREWAYAGLFIDLVGAFISHMAVGDGPELYSGSLIGLVLLLISYVSFRKTHR